MAQERIITEIDGPKLPFKLVGHLNVSGKDAYPDRVLPIGRIGRGFYAVYGSPLKGKLEFDPFIKDIEDGLVNHGRELAQCLKDYDYRVHSLWAHTAEDVVLYEAKKSDVFYRKLLQDPQFSSENPVLRVALAERIGEEAYIKELIDFMPYLARDGHEYVADDWYSQKRKHLNEEDGFNLPERWQDLVVFTKEEK